LQNIKDYKEVIGAKLKDIDIALLFLNAGVGQMGLFADLDEKSVEEMMKVNALHPMYLAKALLPQMLSRGKKSAIIVTSSFLGQRPLGGASIVYSATKSLARFLAIGLSYELDKKIDVLAWDCGEVATKHSGKKEGFNVLEDLEVCRGTFPHIGRDRVTNGHPVHHMFNTWIGWVPLGMLNKISVKYGESVLKKQRKIAAKAAKKEAEQDKKIN
jgi:short-subunit dehydrogenase